MNKIIEALKRERESLRRAMETFPGDTGLLKIAKDQLHEIDMELAELEREEQDRPDTDNEFSDHPPVGFGEMC